MALSSARRWFLIERKSFEVVLEGRQDEKVRFTEFRRRSRSSISLSMEEARWFVTSWPSISREPRVAGSCARYRKGDRCLFLSMHCNDFGWFIKLMEVWKGTAKTIVFPEGEDGSGWEKVRSSSEAIVKLRPEKIKDRAARGFPPLTSQIHKVESTTKGWGQHSKTLQAENATTSWGKQEITIAIVCPCCGDSFEGTLSLKPPVGKSQHLTAADLAVVRSGDDIGCVKEQQAGVVARGSGARTDKSAHDSDASTGKDARGSDARIDNAVRPPAVQRSGPVNKGKKPTFGVKKGVGPVFGRGKDRKPNKRYIRKDLLPGASSKAGYFPDPILGELCSISDHPQTNRFPDNFEPQTTDMCNLIDRQTEEAETSISAGGPCEKNDGILSERVGASQSEHPLHPDSPLSNSEEDRAMVLFDSDTLDAAPIDSRPPAVLTDEEVSKMVLAKAMDVGKMLGLSYDGQEDRAAKLFSSIENRRLKELKRLECGVNYESSAKKGTARGGGKRSDE